MNVPRCRISEWMPAGMLDWPGKLTVTAFISGCDLRCPFCHNPELIDRRESDDSPLRGLLDHIELKRSWIDGVVITGGEPCTDPALRTVLALLRDLRVPVKLDTNGSHPDVLAGLLADDLVAYVAMDVKTVPARYDRLTRSKGAWERISQSIDALLESGCDHEFRTTLYPRAVTLGELDLIAERISEGQRYVLQQFRPLHALDESALEVSPYHADAIRTAAERCSRTIPTTTRGV